MFQINTMRRKSIVRTAADLLHPELVAGEESVASLLDSARPGRVVPDMREWVCWHSLNPPCYSTS